MPNRRVLLADDEPQVRAFVKAFLLALQFEVAEANDGLEALEVIRAAGGLFDLLITDIKMPRMDGIELARSVSSEFPAIPVLFISGYCTEPQGPEGMPRWAFLGKPFLPKDLLRKVDELLTEKPKAKCSVGG